MKNFHFLFFSKHSHFYFYFSFHNITSLSTMPFNMYTYTYAQHILHISLIQPLSLPNAPKPFHSFLKSPLKLSFSLRNINITHTPLMKEERKIKKNSIWEGKRGKLWRRKKIFVRKWKKSESGHYKYIEENDFFFFSLPHTHPLFLIAFLSNNLILN